MKKSSWWPIPAAFFLLVNFSISPVKYLFIKELCLLLFFISLFFFLRRYDLKNIIKLTIGGISPIIFGYGLLQKFVLFPLYLQNLQAQDNFYYEALLARLQSGRIFSIFSLPTLYAIVCVLLILFLLHYAIYLPKTRLYWLILLAAGVANLLLSQSFGGVLYLAAGLLSYFIFSGILKFKYIAPVIMILSLAFFAMIAMRFSEARKLEPLTLRMSNWKQAVRVIETSPLLGTGLGNYEAVIPRFVLSSEAKSIYAHNFILQFTAETGIIFPVVVFLLLILSWRRLKPTIDKENTLYISAFLVLVVYNLVDIGIYFFSAGLILAVVLSQIYRLPRANRRLSFSPDLIALCAFSVILMVTSAADNYQKKGDYSASRNDFAEASRYYRLSISINPFQYKALAGYAHINLQQNNFPEADRYLSKAQDIFPDSAFLNYLRSRVEYHKRHFSQSLYHAARAADNNPINQTYKRWYEYIRDHLQAELANT